MLKNSSDNDEVLEYSAEEVNRMFSEHQKKHRQHSRKNFGFKM